MHGVRISQADFLEITRTIHPIYLKNQNFRRKMKMNRFRREGRIKKEFDAVKAKPQSDINQEMMTEREMEGLRACTFEESSGGEEVGQEINREKETGEKDSEGFGAAMHMVET